MVKVKYSSKGKRILTYEETQNIEECAICNKLKQRLLQEQDNKGVKTILQRAFEKHLATNKHWILIKCELLQQN